MNQSAVHIEELTRKFGALTAVDRVSLDIQKGEIFGLLGSNGAGKTTLMRMLCGILKPSSGKATIAGYNLYREINSIKRNIGYMSQRFSLFEELTIGENIEFYGTIYGLKKDLLREKTKMLFDQLEMDDHKKKLVRNLSNGWRQKLAFAISMIHDPAVVFLDEPTSGVDPINRREFWNMIYLASQKGVTVIVSTHYMDEADYCDRIAIMLNGKVALSGVPSDLRKNYQTANNIELFYKLTKGIV